jgi:hypothetical protein
MRALTQRHTYVGMSRTTHLDHLWLSGQNSFLSENERKNRGCPVRKEQIRKLALERETTVELKRMERDCPMINCFPFLDQPNEFKKGISIMFSNIQTLRGNKVEKIRHDRGFMKADIILLVECHINMMNTGGNRYWLNIDKYLTKLVTGDLTSNSAKGQVMYVKDDIYRNIIRLDDNSESMVRKVKDVVEIAIFQYSNPMLENNNEIYICFLYKHPNMSIVDFEIALYVFLKEYFLLNSQKNSLELKNKDFYLLGDFNIDFNNTADKNIQALKASLERRYGLKPYTYNTRTTKKGTSIDWLFSSAAPSNFEVTMYETWFSDHSPIYLEIFNC